MRYFVSFLLLAGMAHPGLAQATAKQANDRVSAGTDIQFVLQAGTDYTQGQFNGQEYETVSASAGAAYTHGRLTLSASIPYLVTTAPANLVVSQGGLLGTPLFATPASQTTRVRRQGIGDLTLQAAYQLPTHGFDAVVAGAAKVPTASRQDGLGSGAFDYGVSGQISKRLGPIVPFVSAGYTFIGQTEGFAVHNTVSGSAGASFTLGCSSALSLSYAYEQSATDLIGDRQSVGIALGTQLAPRLRMGLNGSAGVSTGAPDAQVGLHIGLGF